MGFWKGRLDPLVEKLLENPTIPFMSDHFADRLILAIDKKQTPICVGIDPILEMIPEEIAREAQQRPEDAEAAIDAIFEFVTRILRIVAPLVPIVKFQSAYFEKYLWEGVEAYYSLIQEAHELGLLVIGDIKRGDIGSTASAYAAGHLAPPDFEGYEESLIPDAATINPMLGLDTLEPFVKAAGEYDKGLFVLVRTSNPGSQLLQDAKLADGRTWSEMLADSLAPLTAQTRGESGYSYVGAVVGATQPHTIQSMRQRLPYSIFLLPGYGTQGATADMTKAAFTNGKGAIISASRSILYAHRDGKYAGENWERCVERAVLDMKQDIAKILG